MEKLHVPRKLQGGLETLPEISRIQPGYTIFNRENLARVDHIRFTDLILVRVIDHGIQGSLAKYAPGNAPQAVARLNDDIGLADKLG